jgi:hypothetical protein
MKIESIAGARKAARRLAGPFQRTFETPLKHLPSFSEILLRGDVTSGHVFVDAVIFDAKHIEALLASHAISGMQIQDSTITASGPFECRALLTAALGDSIDFYFCPVPKRFLLFADHDEYVTLYTHKRGQLSQIEDTLTTAGVREITGFERALEP